MVGGLRQPIGPEGATAKERPSFIARASTLRSVEPRNYSMRRSYVDAPRVAGRLKASHTTFTTAQAIRA